MERVGRNDPCPCGSGKKYKQCCLQKQKPGQKKKFTAKIIQSGTGIEQPKDLMERVFGEAIDAATDDDSPPIPPKDKNA